MERKIIKLNFTTPLHVGDKRLSEGECTIKADTLFSALCLQCEGNDEIARFAKDTKAGKFKFSDCFPFVDKTYYISKPLIPIESARGNQKTMKDWKYIPYNAVLHYVRNTLKDRKLNFLGKSSLRISAHVGYAEEKTTPFEVGIYQFDSKKLPEENAKKGNGLYFIMEYEDDYIFNLLDSLQYSGLGGKRSVGFGRFRYTFEEPFDLGKGGRKILLSTAMAKNEELEKTLNNSSYLLQKRAGWIDGTTLKKRDFYSFASGSVFETGFEGDVFEVGQANNHPVYRYAIPIFMEV